jgi:hypothetical protein
MPVSDQDCETLPFFPPRLSARGQTRLREDALPKQATNIQALALDQIRPQPSLVPLYLDRRYPQVRDSTLCLVAFSILGLAPLFESVSAPGGLSSSPPPSPSPSLEPSLLTDPPPPSVLRHHGVRVGDRLPRERCRRRVREIRPRHLAPPGHGLGGISHGLGRPVFQRAYSNHVRCP